MPLTEKRAFKTGELLRRLHAATATFVPAQDEVWSPWFGRILGDSDRIIGHCDVGPWNIVQQNDQKLVLIDWDYAGPVDPLIDLAQACWLNAKLHDDIVAQNEHLPSLHERARHLRALLEGYQLPNEERIGLVETMIQFAVHSTAAEADEAGIMPDVDTAAIDRNVLWGMAWRSRAAVWMLKNRRTLERAVL
jgi:thiamine kinase-like enzyme